MNCIIDLTYQVFYTITGRPRHPKSMNLNDSYVGDYAFFKKDLLDLCYPIRHGIVNNWDDMEKIWNQIYCNEFCVSPTEHPVLMTEAPLNPKINREKMTQIMFETFNVPAFYVHSQAVLSLYGSGYISGILVNSGFDVTSVVPIREGHAITHAIAQMNLAGNDLTTYLTHLLIDRGYAIDSNIGKATIREIKEKLCYVAHDFEQEMKANVQYSPTTEMAFRLPDDHIIDVGNER
jgi:actin-related protein